MWALGRASNTLKGRAFIIQAFQNSYPNSQVGSRNLYDKAGHVDSHMAISDRCTYMKSSQCAVRSYAKFSLWWCSFSSQAGSNNIDNEEDDLEDGFSELETPTESENELSSEPELSEEEQNDHCEGTNPQDGILVSDSDELEQQKNSTKKRVSLALFKAIVDDPSRAVKSALDKWVEDGNELNESEVSVAMFNLRVRNMYGRALQFSDWLESLKTYEFNEREYAARAGLIAKVHGLHAAESYINKIPESFKNEVIYQTFLASCVSTTDVKKSEAVFNKLKDFEFGVSSSSCNQLLILYKKTDKKKVADVLLLMEKENVKPTLFTYRILIDMKGESNDISGMEQIVETMKAKGVEPDLQVQATLAQHYIKSGFKEKAESVLREMEGDDLRQRKWVCKALLPLYGFLGKGDEVARVWEACAPRPRLEDCVAAIFAWGRLGNVEKAEAVFEKMTKIAKKLSPDHYSVLLKVYANHRMVKKGENLVTQMAESGTIVGPQTWHDLVRLYVNAGQVEKADSILQKATQQTQMKPWITSYMAIMNRYARKGDVHNTEKILYKMRQAGYICELRQYHSLIWAYVNANEPAYGIRERMKADNIFPNSVLTALLEKVDPFRKTPVSALLD